MAQNSVQFPEVTATNSGFRLAGGVHEPLDVRWDDVVEIVAFKRDVVAYDVICLGFRLHATGEFVEVAEDFPGYDDFLIVVEGRFPLADGWWRAVAFPMLATNWSTIWTCGVRT